jgi:hypothetical protein
VLGHVAAALGRRIRIELEALPLHLDFIAVFELLQRGFEPALADVAPRTYDV